MVIKYYVTRIIYGDLEYLKDTNNHLLEFDTEEEARASLQEQKRLNLKGLLCWKKEEIE